MIRVKMTKKLYSSKGILLGYELEDAEGRRVRVTKENVKAAIINGQIDVVNLTLKSDGRLIGSTSNKKAARSLTESGMNIIEAYTLGKNIVGALENDTEYYKRNGVDLSTVRRTNGLASGYKFIDGITFNKMVSIGVYDNITMIDEKIDFSEVKKKSFKSIRNKLINMISTENIKINTNVAKTNMKDIYDIEIMNIDELMSKGLDDIAKCLIIYSLLNDKLRPLKVDGSHIYVRNILSIKEVRSALKSVDVLDKK